MTIVTAWDSAFEQLAAFTWPRLQAFAERHGYVIRRGQLTPGRHPAWSKIPLLHEALNEDDCAAWFDADCLITGDADLHSLLDNADLAWAESNDGPNTGSIVVRSCQWTRDWLASAWALETDYKGHRWFESPALWRAAEPYKDRINLIPRRRLSAYATNEIGHWEPGDFILHLAGMPMEERIMLATAVCGGACDRG